MDTSYTQPTINRQIFSDLHHIESGDYRWDLPFIKISNGDFHGSVNAVDMGTVQMVEGRFNGTLLQNGFTPKGYLTFAIPAIDSMPFWWHYRKVDSNHLLFFPDSRELKCISYNGFHVYTVSILEEFLMEMIDRCGFQGLSAKLRGSEKVIPLSRPNVYKLNSLMQSISLKLQVDQGVGASRSLQRQLQYKTTEVLLNLVHQSEESTNVPIQRTRDRTILKAIEFILNSDLQGLTSEELCEKTGIKRRSLEYAFQEYVGVGPKGFIKAIRLNHLRQTLRKEALSISVAAARHGFTHLGQLSRDYKLLFGELPSATIKRNRS